MSIWVKIPLALLLLFIGLIFLSVMGLEWTVQAAFFLLVGWIPFLADVVSQVTVRWNLVFEALLVAGALVAGTHLFIRRFWPRFHAAPEAVTPWPLRWSLSLVAMLVLLFLATMSTMGIAHHVGWLASGRAPIFRTRLFPMFAHGMGSHRLCRTALERVSAGVSPGQVPALLLAGPTTREDAEEHHVFSVPGPGGRPGFVVYPRDPRQLVEEGGFRCDDPNEKPVHMAAPELVKWRSEQHSVAAPTPP
ncbi:hypothetical protein LY474_09635 [Myxococcus stipitatus]|uniref:hypothetical protein n=1 Tax=Myxococcus stipitatus TaxID=83455 RepID=UPI001F1811EB|nr:hypothetical protein [Myxococcus stipitatus]MCE9668073.1 hypothetical protein [Myxococcus stipitatus]